MSTIDEAPAKVEAEDVVAPAVASDDKVPAEVEAMDGVASDEEAHNVDRPARGSGIHKHKDGDRKKRVELKDLEIGAEVTAKVKTVTAYGAFLDIGAKSDALIHVSRLSDNFVSNVEDVVKQGDEITVRIISVDTDKNQIGVTMRSVEAEENAVNNSGRPQKRRERPQRSGGDQAAQAAAIQALVDKGFDDTQFVEGEVVSSLAFGAFVRFDSAQLGDGLEGEVDGLVHISALSEGRANSVEDIVSIGDKVSVRVRSVDAEAGRISLSMITKEQEEASRPAPRQRNEERSEEGAGGRAPDAIAASWKDTGAEDWKEQMADFQQPGFTNTAVVVDRRK
jgi:predicted RNA-binding protein with RPS1 domain